jgi:arylsulfatase A-like enzyme
MLLASQGQTRRVLLAQRRRGEVILTIRSSSIVLCLVLLTVAAVVTMHGCGAAPDSRPNVVLIIIDTLRADFLGCYGCEVDTSPQIDEIAGRGVLFERTLSQCSWTRPSIASMLTSHYPRTLGIYKEKYDILAEEYSTLAEILNQSGYTTIGITANPHLNKVFNLHQGFDDYVESSVIWPWMQPEKGKIRMEPAGKINLPRSGEILGWVMQRAKSGISGPAYVQINIMEVHSPSLVLGWNRWLYDNVDVNVDEDEPLERRGPLKRLVRGTYCAVSQVSEQVGSFIDVLSSLPGWKNTLFVITSDHGQGLGDHPDVRDSVHHGNLLYDSQVRVPLILYNPADTTLVCGGKRVKDMVRLLDVLPTVLTYVGIDTPADAKGESLLGLLPGGGEPPDLPEVFVAETNWKDVDKIAAYTSEWKYIENRDGWEGVNPFELQHAGIVENGALTDSIYSNPGEAERLKMFLKQWERSFPRAERTQPYGLPTDAEIEQLKSLGYMK